MIIPDASSDTSLLRGCKLDKGTMPGDGDTWGRYTIVPVGLKAPLGRWKVQTFADRVNHAGETVITYYSEISNSKSLTTETTISLNAEISGTFKKVTGNLGLGYAIRKATDEQSGTSFGTSVKYTVPDGKKVVVFFYELLYKEYKMFSQQTIVEWPLKDPDKKFLLTNELSLKYEDHAK